MKTRLFVLLFIPLLLVPSCKQKSSYLDELEKSRQEKEVRLKQCADSTVNLSFKGITLATPIKATLNAALKAGQIKNLKYEKGGSATCNADITLPNRETPLTVDVKIASYQDTITSFIVMSDVYETYPALIRLYKDKYNEGFASIEDHAADWGDRTTRSGNQSFVWTFKNQTLRVSDFYSETRENYVKDPRMRSPENRYGVKYTKYFQAVSIIYSDIKQCKKVEAVEERERQIENARNRQKQAEDAAKQDSQRKKALDQDI